MGYAGTHLSRPIIIVILDVPCGAVNTVSQITNKSPLSGTRKVILECTCTTVRDGDKISMIRPH